MISAKVGLSIDLNTVGLKRALIKCKTASLMGSGSGNTVEVLGNGYLLKKFATKEACLREFYGAKVFSSFMPQAIPQVILVDSKTCLIKEITEAVDAFTLISRGHITKSEVNRFIKNIKRSADIPMDYLPVDAVGALSWGTFLAELKLKLSNKSLALVSLLGEQAVKDFENILASLEEESLSDGFVGHIALHRDIHYSNILVDKEGRMYLIDFEQAVIGPKEFEFQNALFWADSKSVDIEVISDLVPLGARDSRFEMLYLLDQFLKALKV